MLHSLITNEGGEFGHTFSTDYTVLHVKFPCAVALHLCLYPEVMSGMTIMKFSNNQPELFENNGSQIAFFIGFMQYLTAVFCECINLYMLTYQHSVEHCLIHFVALEVIMELPKMYFEALADSAIKEVVHHYHPKRKNRGQDIKFTERTCFHRFARVIYKILRTIYVAVIFYFAPFVVIFLNFWADTDVEHE